ncbi:MAG: NADH-quinone oxidoreductase subunit L [Actinobacteria bacterium]|nr:NADH-quinone oxidoreductase subunit L [Actinomycetota bacterium]
MLSAVWLIPALPLAGFLILLAAGRKLGEPAAGWLATAMVTGSFVAGLVTFAGLLGEDEHHRQFVFTVFEWLPSGSFSVDVGFLVDPLSMAMVLFVTGVGALIHLYSIGYMHGDPRFHTFFLYLNLFAFSMLMLVLGDNLLITFLGWEGVGACSYLLVSFWFERNSAAVAGKKAFVTNRVGDWGFMVAIFLTFASLGTLTYAGEEGFLENAGALPEATALGIALLLFVGAAGKSAQLPLYVWLPDAMEGPTPVSALIHAATMVTAGVYLMARVNPLLDAAPAALTVISVIGAATALFAATCAVAQRDIKKVLAYSTVSQLGYMFLAIGVGAYVAAIFHMITHAFFKALLFLGAGSVIHGLHDEQDMRRMGGLRKLMPITAGTFIVGWLAIAGIPPFSGFWSKDEILAAAWDSNRLLWLVGVITALLTAYYMSRQVFLVFFGPPRWQEAHAGATSEEALAEPEHEPAAAEAAPATPHESPPTMTVPLVVLAVLAAAGGLLNLPGVLTLEHFLEPVFEDRLHHLDIPAGILLTLAAVTTVGVVIGILAARAIYLRSTQPADRFEPELLRRAWGFDQALAGFFGGPGRAFANFTSRVLDGRGIDGAVNGVATLVRGGGSRLRLTQTGYVRNYALFMGGGAVLLLAFFLLRTGVA